MKLTKILLSTDFSDAARKAYPAAAALARKAGAEIHLVHVAEPLPPHFYLHGMGIPTDVPDASFLRDLENRLADVEAKHASLSALRVTTKLLYHAFPAEALAHYARESGIDLAVLASKGRASIAYSLLGSFCRKALALMPVPVLIWREPQAKAGAPLALREVVVPWDFSENCKAVIPAMRYLAREYGSRFTLVHAIEDLILVELSPSGEAAAAMYRAHEEAPKRAQERFAELRQEELKGLDVQLEIRKGTPYHEILEHLKAKPADLVLMATHGWTGFKHFMLGSVAERLVHKVPCPVMTVRGTAKS